MAKNIGDTVQAEQDTNDRISEARAKITELVKQSAKERQASRKFTSLGSYLEDRWQIAKERKRVVQRELYESALQRKGEYTSDKYNQIQKFGGTDIFMNLTSVKCRAAESWIRDILGPEIWTIEPTPIPDLPLHIQQFVQQFVMTQITQNPGLLQVISGPQEMYDYIYKNTREAMVKRAKLAASRMELKIKDQLVEARWRKTLTEVISDIVTYKAGIMKGVVVRRRLGLSWRENPQTGMWQAVQSDNIVIDYDRVSPFDLYPVSSVADVDSTDLFERHRLSRKDLVALMDVPGYDTESIRLVLDEYGEGGLQNWIYDEEYVEGSEGSGSDRIESRAGIIDALEYWGSCQGKRLLEWGLKDPRIDDPQKEYQISAWKIGPYIIKAMINEHPTGRKPYKKTSYELIPGSFWGRGVPELMKDIQQVCNASARSLVNNMALSSGPQVMLDTEQFEGGTNEEEMYPWKIWRYDPSSSRRPTSVRPIEFFQPNPIVAQLLKIYEYYERRAEDYTGIPAYVYGSGNVGGAGRALADYEKVITPDGMVEIGAIEEGCLVSNSYGSFSEVIGVYPQGETDIFRVKFSNGEYVDCDADHRWSEKY